MKLPDTLCRLCGNDLIGYSRCVNCRQVNQLKCIKCDTITDIKFHYTCFPTISFVDPSLKITKKNILSIPC